MNTTSPDFSDPAIHQSGQRASFDRTLPGISAPRPELPPRGAASFFNPRTARACVGASRLAYLAPTIAAPKCHLTLCVPTQTGPDGSGTGTDMGNPGPQQAASGDASSGLIVAFRGTANLVDFISDLECWRIAVPGPESGGSLRSTPAVHAGFWLALLQIFDELAREITRHPPQPLLVTGHSLGGALAMLFTYKWHLPPREPVPWRAADYPIAGTYTFGQPRSGNHAFAAGFDERHRANTFRCVNDEDVIPRLPGLLSGYRHAGQAVFLPSPTTSEVAEAICGIGRASYWVNPPWQLRLVSAVVGLVRLLRRAPRHALGGVLMDHHISRYAARIGVTTVVPAR